MTTRATPATATGHARWSAETWRRTAALRRAIHALPFNRALADGTLDTATFQGYVLQDSLYLAQFGRALAAAAARSPDADDMLRFAGSAQGAIAVERALHERYFAEFGLSAEAVAAAEPSPTCLAYTSFLIATAFQASYAELVAALLPCFWIYRDVGHAVDAEAAADNPFRAWIDTYADEAFSESVDAVIAAADRIAAAEDPATVAAMHAAFARSARYEWMFWDAAWRREDWPVAAA